MTRNTIIPRAVLVALALLICSCSAATPNFAMQFHSSSFLVNSGSSAAPHGIAVPVAIQLVDSEGRADTTDSSIVVTASVSGGASISGNVATVQNGVARFMMTFTSCTGGAVTFTAHSANGAAVSGKTLVSGVISVAPVPNAEVMFDASSVLQAGQPTAVTAGAAIPAFKITLYDSCGNVDTSMTGLTISAATSTGATLGGATTATFTDGVAIFSGLLVEESTTTQLTFTVGASATPVAASSKTLATGTVSVQPKARTALSHSAMAVMFAGVCVAMLVAVVAVSSASSKKGEVKYVIVASTPAVSNVV